MFQQLRFNRYLLLPLMAFALASLWSCEGDYRKAAQGTFGELIVVMDSTRLNSATAEAIRNSFGDRYPGLPGYEPHYDIRFVDFETQSKLDQIKRMQNLIIAAPLDEQTEVGELVRAMLSEEVEQRVEQGQNFAFPLGDRWYRNQWVLLLTAPTDTTLARKIRNSEDQLVGMLDKVEIKRWKYEIYEKGERTALEDSLWKDYGWKLRIQHDYVRNVDTTGFVSFHRYLPENDRWIWVWWENGVKNIDRVDDEWINAKRDSLLKTWIRGTRDSSYVTTEYRRPVQTATMTINGNFAYETRGTWKMTGDLMGGPFLNYTIYDDETNRLFMMEFAQFAPRYKKRRFVRQFEAMATTFRTDSTWTADQQ